MPIIIDNEDIFDPAIHLSYTPPTKSFTLADLALTPSATSTPIAGTVPFPLLSHEGVRAYRRSLFHPAVLKTCSSQYGTGTLILRNAAAHSRFIRDFWTHPATMRIVSEAAGVPLAIVARTEIGHTNIQIMAEGAETVDDMVRELRVEPDRTKVELSEEDRAYDPLSADSIIPWHYDSYPYVCVLMLSDTEGMLGGETYIKTGDGVPMKAPNPNLGSCVILQGGEVEHLAARAVGVRERISTITSYRADVAATYDNSRLSNIRPYSDPRVLYRDWAAYRLAKLRDELDGMLRKVEGAFPGEGESAEGAQAELDVPALHAFAEHHAAYLTRTAREVVPYEDLSALLTHFGHTACTRAGRYWAAAQSLPEFAARADGPKARAWRRDSPLWIDLAATRVRIARGEALDGQAAGGRGVWKGSREYVMGDELIRQGLKEYCLEWMEAAGLWEGVKGTV